jgi:maltose alpha-D-glucosyltransferase/alpha-amylase
VRENTPEDDGAADGDFHDVVLCVNNLSRFPQPIELDLQPWNGYTPVELTGRVDFPRIGQLPYLLTLPGHGFYWFQLCKIEDPSEMTP